MRSRRKKSNNHSLSVGLISVLGTGAITQTCISAVTLASVALNFPKMSENRDVLQLQYPTAEMESQ